MGIVFFIFFVKDFKFPVSIFLRQAEKGLEKDT